MEILTPTHQNLSFPFMTVASYWSKTFLLWPWERLEMQRTSQLTTPKTTINQWWMENGGKFQLPLLPESSALSPRAPQWYWATVALRSNYLLNTTYIDPLYFSGSYPQSVGPLPGRVWFSRKQTLRFWDFIQKKLLGKHFLHIWRQIKQDCAERKVKP